MMQNTRCHDSISAGRDLEQPAFRFVVKWNMESYAFMCMREQLLLSLRTADIPIVFID